MALQSLLALAALLSGPLPQHDSVSTPDPEEDQEQLWSLAVLDTEDAHKNWRAVHDVVMGGISDGVSARAEDGVRFQGVMRVEGGGFASFRTQATASLEGADGVRVRASGDGKTWKLTLRSPKSRIAWQAPIRIRGGEEEGVCIPFEDFTPTFRGQLVTGAPPLEPAQFTEVGFTLGDKQAGAYWIELEGLEAWRAPGGGFPEGSEAARVARTQGLRTALVNAPSDDTLLDRVTWNERLLVVAEPLRRGSLGPEASLQRGLFAESARGLAARDLRVVHIAGLSDLRVAGVSLGPAAARALRERWELSPNAFACALIGKDGGVKVRWEGPVEPSLVFTRIDAMPMREEEQRRRNSDK